MPILGFSTTVKYFNGFRLRECAFERLLAHDACVRWKAFVLCTKANRRYTALISMPNRPGAVIIRSKAATAKDCA